MPIWRETRALNADTPRNRHHENPPRFISRLLAALLEQWRRMHYARSRDHDKRETQPSLPDKLTWPHARPLARAIETHMLVSGDTARAASYVRDLEASDECVV